VGEGVLEPLGVALVGAALDHARLLEHPEPRGDAVARSAGAADDVGEAAAAHHDLADHEQCPPLADHVQRGRAGAGAPRQLGKGLDHVGSVARVSLKIKPTRPQVDTSTPLVPVALGTALVLVTYVTPIATIPATAADLGAGPVARAWILSSMSVG